MRPSRTLAAACALAAALGVAACTTTGGPAPGAAAPAAQTALRAPPYHAPTPTAVPGARVVGTPELEALLAGPARPVLINALDGRGPERSIPGAARLGYVGHGGSFDDEAQRKLAAFLDAATGGDRARPVVTFCRDANCWLSWNAAVRAARLGYANVLWYRDGIEGWTGAGKPSIRDPVVSW